MYQGSQPLPLLTSEEMRAWDRSAVEQAEIPERALMENAGRAAAGIVTRAYPSGKVVGVIGGGNNGGDGVVMLRTLAAWGRKVVAVPAGEAAIRQALLAGWEIPVERDLGVACRGASVLVDAVLGTGARGAPRGDAAAAIRQMRAAGKPVLALDAPSGVDLTDGSAAGDVVQAEITVTFGAPKRGLLLFPGRSHAGRIVVVEVGFPPHPGAGAAIVTEEWVRATLPGVAPNVHKGQAGKVVVLAGHPGMGGAAILAAMGALRGGAGGVRVVSDAANRVPIQTAVPEALFVDRAAGEVDGVLDWADALVVGPGMGTGDEPLALLRRVLERSRSPVLLDADAVTLLARHPDLLASERSDRVLLTPHPGEMARLIGRGTDQIVADPFDAVSEAVRRFGCAILLKGTPSMVGAPGEPVLVNVTGHSGVATGGMGDTLSGLCGALLAAGSAPREAGACGLFLAGRAAEIAGRRRSLLPRDVAESLSRAFAAVEDWAPADRPPGVLAEIPAAR